MNDLIDRMLDSDKQLDEREIPTDKTDIQWQAASHPELARREPDELFEPEFAERYRRLHNDLWQRIMRLHGTIHTLETLVDFPFDYLYLPNGMEFWRLVVQNFVDMAIVSLHGLVNDETRDAHTIHAFKNEIAKDKKQWVDQGIYALFCQTLKDRKFDPDAVSVAERVQRIRHERIAHRLIDRKTGTDLKEHLDGVSLPDLRKLFRAAHSLFGVLSFGTVYSTLAGDLMPGTIGGKPRRTCLEEVLDAVLRDNDFVNRPERRDQWWPTDRDQMEPEELSTMNELRKRVGLPEA